jgi:hypothetical protein
MRLMDYYGFGPEFRVIECRKPENELDLSETTFESERQEMASDRGDVERDGVHGFERMRDGSGTAAGR